MTPIRVFFILFVLAVLVLIFNLIQGEEAPDKPLTEPKKKVEKIQTQPPEETLDKEKIAPTVVMKEAPKGVRLKGKVLDEQGKAIHGALVNYLRTKVQKTDSDGSFEIAGLDPGEINIRITALGYQSQFVKGIKVQEGMKDLSFTLLQEGTYSVSGVVLNDLNDPIKGVEIGISQSFDNNSVERLAVSNDRGEFQASGFFEGFAYLNISSMKGAPREWLQKVEVGRQDIVVVVDRFARIQGKVVYDTGEPVETFTVSPDTEFVRGNRENFEFKDGVFDVSRVLPGEVTLVVTPAKMSHIRSKPIKIGPGQEVKDVVIVVNRLGGIRGVVRDRESRQPIAGCQVTAVSHVKMTDEMTMRVLSPEVKTDENGIFIFQELKAGVTDLKITHPDYCNLEKEKLILDSGQMMEGVEILLFKGGGISGYVTKNGQAQANAHVGCWGDSSHRHGAITDQNGYYQLKNLYPREYRVYTSFEKDISQEIRVTVRDGETMACNLSIDMGVTLQGKTYLFGKPRSGVKLNLYSEDIGENMSCSRKAVSNETGDYLIKGLYPGKYYLYAKHRAGKSKLNYEGPVTVGPGPNVLDLTLCGPGASEISGYVICNGSVVKDIEVTLKSKQYEDRKRTDLKGFFCFKEVPSGPIVLKTWLLDQGFDPSPMVEKSLNVVANKNHKEDLVFQSGTGIVHGMVYLNKELIKSSPRIQLIKTDQSPRISYFARGKDDSYRAENLPPGRYDVFLTRPYPWRVRQEIEVFDHREVQMDFQLYSGSASIKGSVEGDAKAYLFNKNACALKKGQTFQTPYVSEGLVTQLIITSDQEVYGQDLPAGVFELAILLVKENKIQELYLETIELKEGQEHKVHVKWD